MAWRAGEKLDLIYKTWSKLELLGVFEHSLVSPKGWQLATHTTRSCRGKSPNWRNATCESFEFFQFSRFPPDLHGDVYNGNPSTRAAVNIWTCCKFLLILSSLFAPQVPDGAAAQTAGPGHEYI